MQKSQPQRAVVPQPRTTSGLADGRDTAPQFSLGPAAFKSGSAVDVTPSATKQNREMLIRSVVV